MAKVLTLVLSGLALFAWIGSPASAASEQCKDCSTDTGLTIREQIKADRAREAERIARESTARPWDGKDFGQTKRTNAPPVAR
jgi:hypothetical protein